MERETNYTSKVYRVECAGLGDFTKMVPELMRSAAEQLNHEITHVQFGKFIPDKWQEHVLKVYGLTRVEQPLPYTDIGFGYSPGGRPISSVRRVPAADEPQPVEQPKLAEPPAEPPRPAEPPAVEVKTKTVDDTIDNAVSLLLKALADREVILKRIENLVEG